MTAKSPLDRVLVATPCHVSWASMQGNDRLRYCGQCRKNVYNLSAMDRSAAELLVLAQEGQFCVRYYQRSDGTVITADCPVGVAAWRRKWGLLGGVVAAIGLMVVGLAGVVSHAAGSRRTSNLRSVEPFATVLDWVDPRPMVVQGGCMPLRAAPTTADSDQVESHSTVPAGE